MAVKIVGKVEEDLPPLPPPGTVLRGTCDKCKTVFECGPEDVVHRDWVSKHSEESKRRHGGIFVARCLCDTPACVKPVEVIDLVLAPAA